MQLCTEWFGKTFPKGALSPVDTERPVAWTLVEVGVSFVDGAFDTQLEDVSGEREMNGL